MEAYNSTYEVNRTQSLHLVKALDEVFTRKRDTQHRDAMLQTVSNPPGQTVQVLPQINLKEKMLEGNL